MKRDLAQLANNSYDLLVIGGGIYGACVAWDATLRGLSVALLEKGDFGHATSANSLKIIHGGLRYLQDADLGLVREMIHERMAFMRIAPHLIHPLPCVMPTYKRFTRSRAVMWAALAINDLVGLDRNRLEDPQKYLPGGRLISRGECLRILPGLAEVGLTGGAIWHDCQMHNSERLTLSFLLSAAAAGAHVANYVEVIGFLRKGDRVIGVEAKDVLADETLDIRATIVVNATGPWVDHILGLLNAQRRYPKFHASRAMNLVTRQIIPGYAVGVPSRSEPKNSGGVGTKKSRLLFIVPWRNHSLIGTTHIPCFGRPDDCQVTEEDVQDLINEVNRAYPGAQLGREDVRLYHSGFLPMTVGNGRDDGVQLVRRSQIYDHQKEDGVAGLMTVVGVKYTMARSSAQRAVDLVFRNLGRAAPKCLTGVTPLHGGQIDRFDDFLAREVVKRPAGLSPEVVRHLVFHYGSEYPQVLKYIDEDPRLAHKICGAAEAIQAEVLHAVREEMAQKLADVILRRTDLGSSGNPGETCLRSCAALMAKELGWNEAQIAQNVNEAGAVFPVATRQPLAMLSR